MTERRPHWDDDLIRSVHRVSPVSMLMPPNDVYAIIAAVEDHLKAKRDSALGGADSTPLRGEVVAELNGDLLLRIIKANRDNPHRICDCGSGAPNCEVCDERWPCTEATVAQVLAKPYLNARPHGQPDQWREGYNQALREIRRVLAVASPRAGIRRSRPSVDDIDSALDGDA